MADFATLALVADTRGLERGVAALDDLVKASGRAEDAVEGVGEASKKAGQDVSAAAKGMGRDINGLTGIINKAKAALGALGLALSVREIARMADSWSDLQSRVGLAIGDMSKAPAVMQRISEMARRSYSGLAQTAEGFTQNATALRELGLSANRSLDFIEAMNNAMVVSGARGEQATRVMTALSNAMAVGRLQGDQLNTVLMDGGRVAQLLATELNTTTLGLRQMAAEGKITGDVIVNALIGNLALLRAEAEQMPATIGDGFTAIGNSVLTIVGRFDQWSGASETVATALLFLADNMQSVAVYVGTAAAAVIGLYTPAIIAATAKTALWAAGLVTLKGALIATGIGAFVVVAGTLVNMMINLVQRTGGWGKALSLLGEVASAVWEGIKTGASSIPGYLAGVWGRMQSGFLWAIGTMADGWATFMRSIANSAENLANIEVFGMRPFEGMTQGLSRYATEAMRYANDILEASMRAKAESDEAFRRAKDAVVTGSTTISEALARLAATVDEAGEPITEIVPPTLEVTDALGGAGGAAAGVSDALQELADSWRQKVRRPLAEAQASFAELDRLLAAGAISAEEHAAAMEEVAKQYASSIPAVQQVAQGLGDVVGNLFTGMYRSAKDALDAIKEVFRRTLQQMISAAVQNRIMIAFGMTAAGAGTAIAGSAAQAGLGSVLGGFLGTWGKGTAAGGAGLLGGLGNALSGGFLNALNIDVNAAMAGGGLMATIGAAIPVLGAVGLLASALIGKKTLKSAGVTGEFGGDMSQAQTYSVVEKRRLFGLIRSSKTRFAEAPEIQALVNDLALGMRTAVADMADVLALAHGDLRAAIHKFTVDTRNMSEDEIRQAMMLEAEAYGEVMARMVLGTSQFIREGEGALDALRRLSVALVAVNRMTDMLGHSFRAIGVAGADMASQLVEAFGGIDAMTTAADRYFELFYNEKERRAVVTRQVAAELAKLNVAMPQTRAEYRALLEAMDLTTSRGREAYAALMSMAEAFDFILPAVANFTAEISGLVDAITSDVDGMIAASAEAQRASEAAASLWYRAASSLRQLIDRMLGAESPLVSGQNAQAYNQARFQTLLAQGLAGDAQAVSDISAVAQALVSSARLNARDRISAARVEARVLSDLQLLSGASDIEGARHEAIASLLGQQVDLLKGVRDYLNSGEALDASAIESLNAELGRLQQAIAAAETINYAFLKERLNVAVDLMIDADIPADVRAMLAATASGIERDIDLIVRSHWTTPDEKWLALTAASEHIKSLRFVVTQPLDKQTRRLALDVVGDLRRAIRFSLVADVDAETRRIALANSSELARVINIALGHVDPVAMRLALGGLGDYGVAVAVSLSPITNPAVRRLVLEGGGSYAATIEAVLRAEKLGAAERRILLKQFGGYEIRGKANLWKWLREEERRMLWAQRGDYMILGRADLWTNLREEERRILWKQAGDYLIRGALGWNALSKTERRILWDEIGSYLAEASVEWAGLTPAQRRILWDQHGEYLITGRADLWKGLTPEQRRILWAQTGDYLISGRADLWTRLREGERRILWAQKGDYLISGRANLWAGMNETERRILWAQEGGYVAKIMGILASGMSPAVQELLLNANTAATRAITVAAVMDMPAADRTLLTTTAAEIRRTIRAVLAPVEGTDRPYAIKVLGQRSEEVEKIIRGSVDVSRLTPQQLALLNAINGSTGAAIMLGGVFSFDPTNAFKLWYEGRTEALVTAPMHALSDALTGLATVLRDQARRTAAMQALSALTYRPEAQYTSPTGWTGQGAYMADWSQLYSLATALGVATKTATGEVRNIEATRRATEDALRAAGLIAQDAMIWLTHGPVKNSAAQAEWSSWLKTHVPGFASGGVHTGGLRIVGEQGPELEATGPSRIHTASDLMRPMVDELRRLRAEVERMRNEQRSLGISGNRHAKKVADVVQRWAMIGLAEPGAAEASIDGVDVEFPVVGVGE